MTVIHDPAYRDSPQAAEDARVLACLGAAGPVAPKVGLLASDRGRQILTRRMVAVAEREIATSGAVTRAYLLTQFKPDEVAALFDRVIERLSLATRDLALAA